MQNQNLQTKALISGQKSESELEGELLRAEKEFAFEKAVQREILKVAEKNERAEEANSLSGLEKSIEDINN